jgi:beta-mannosidase
VTLSHNDETLDSWSKEVGFRRAELVQQPLEGQSGKSFFFRINNIPIFCCGSNWIPAHSFESRLEESDYKEWVDLIVSGNQDMLRSKLATINKSVKFLYNPQSGAVATTRMSDCLQNV